MGSSHTLGSSFFQKKERCSGCVVDLFVVHLPRVVVSSRLIPVCVVKVAKERSEARPKILKELLAMDLDSVPVRDIKAIMIKLGVSPHDCFERKVTGLFVL